MIEAIEKLVSEELVKLKIALDGFDMLAGKIDLGIVEYQLRKELISMSASSRRNILYNYNEDAYRQASLMHYNNSDDLFKTRKQLSKFKAYYILWVKNFIAKLNKIKIQNKDVKIDVKKLAVILTTVEIQEAARPAMKLSQKIINLVESSARDLENIAEYLRKDLTDHVTGMIYLTEEFRLSTYKAKKLLEAWEGWDVNESAGRKIEEDIIWLDAFFDQNESTETASKK